MEYNGDMKSSTIIHQRPAPKVEVLDSEGGWLLTLGTLQDPVLQSYQFSLSNNDVNGSFSLTLFPERIEPVTGGRGPSYFDLIPLLSIVKIYEGTASKPADKPVFTGVVNKKRYVMQAGDSVSRRLSVSGVAITSLVSQFKLIMDVTCLTVRDKLGNAGVGKELSEKLAGCDTMAGLIEVLWKFFCDKALQFGTCKVLECIQKYMGETSEVFRIKGEMRLFYSPSSLYDDTGENCVMEIVDKVTPAPLYEKTAITADDGKMCIRVREVPFDNKNWNALDCFPITPILVKDITVEQSDKEVYTAFFAYLNGFPVDKDKLMTEAITGSTPPTDHNGMLSDENMFQLYGYRPLVASFNGFDGVKDNKLIEKINKMTEEIRNYYCHLPQMLSGNITLAMEYGAEHWVMPGSKVKVLGGEFYVDGISHSWSYGGGGEINLAISRGGKYNDGNFSPLKDFTKALKLLEEGKAAE